MDLGHVGIHVCDFELMLGFYQRVFGFVISDIKRSESKSIVFLTSEPTIHHQLVLASGRERNDGSRVINQISFRVNNLDDLRRIHAALKQETVTELDVITHGIAWSVYFRDPEGNRAEGYVDTPWYIDQPYRSPIDLSKSDDELRRDTEILCRAQPGFRSFASWTENLVQQYHSAKGN
jgi:catechol-2,3-dioxygenase